MKKEEIIEAIEMLSASQGFYGRLYRRLTNGSEEAEQALAKLEEQKFKDIVDLVLFLEG